MLSVRYKAVTAGVNGHEFTRVVLVSIAIKFQLLCCCKLENILVTWSGQCSTGKTRDEKERDMGCRDISNFGK